MDLQKVSTFDLLEEINRRINASDLNRVPVWAIPTLELVAKEYKCAPFDLVPDNRRSTKEITNARYLAMYLLRVTKPTYSLHVIGSIFSRDYSLVSFATNKIKALIDKNPAAAALIHEMITKLTSAPDCRSARQVSSPVPAKSA